MKYEKWEPGDETKRALKMAAKLWDERDAALRRAEEAEAQVAKLLRPTTDDAMFDYMEEVDRGSKWMGLEDLRDHYVTAMANWRLSLDQRDDALDERNAAETLCVALSNYVRAEFTGLGGRDITEGLGGAFPDWREQIEAMRKRQGK